MKYTTSRTPTSGYIWSAVNISIMPTMSTLILCIIRYSHLIVRQALLLPPHFLQSVTIISSSLNGVVRRIVPHSLVHRPVSEITAICFGVCRIHMVLKILELAVHIFCCQNIQHSIDVSWRGTVTQFNLNILPFLSTLS